MKQNDRSHMWRERLFETLKIFTLGMLCFIVSQMIIRIPLLNWLIEKPSVYLWSMRNPFVWGTLLAFSAGVFEEGGRFLFKSGLLQPAVTTIREPIVFGLGHGFVEALIFLLPIFQMPTLSWGTVLPPAILERLLAIIIHINLSILVWTGFQRNRRKEYLLKAIFAHGLTNFGIPLLMPLRNYDPKYFTGAMFGWLLVAAGVLTWQSIKQKKYYSGGEHESLDEKTDLSCDDDSIIDRMSRQ